VLSQNLGIPLCLIKWSGFFGRSRRNTVVVVIDVVVVDIAVIVDVVRVVIVVLVRRSEPPVVCITR
jgi:hypothetical protein